MQRNIETLILFLLLFGVREGFAQTQRLQTLVSSSTQFIAIGSPEPVPTPHYFNHKPETRPLLLDPATALVLAERVKQTLLRELEVRDQYRGQIYLRLRRSREASEPVLILNDRYLDGWKYTIDLPSEIPKEKLVGALIRVLLQEITNRSNPVEPVELPRWLQEGMTEYLSRMALQDYFNLSRPERTETGLRLTSAVRVSKKEEFLTRYRKLSSEYQPLSLEHMSFPPQAFSYGPGAEFYRESAHLFIRELMQLPQGKRQFAHFLSELGRHLNWQTAFLKAFRSEFPDLLQAEKWWSLSQVRNSLPAANEKWSLPESSTRIRELLKTPVEVRVSTNDVPFQTEATLQACIEEWDPKLQFQVLQGKLNLLQLVQPKLAAEAQPLAAEYYRVIEKYLQHRRKTSDPRKIAVLVEQMKAHLTTLDLRLQGLVPIPSSPKESGISQVR